MVNAIYRVENGKIVGKQKLFITKPMRFANWGIRLWRRSE
jgi:hypothetical protein